MFISVRGFCSVYPSTNSSKCFYYFWNFSPLASFAMSIFSTSLLFICSSACSLCNLLFAVSAVSAISEYVYQFLRNKVLYFEGIVNVMYLETLN